MKTTENKEGYNTYDLKLLNDEADIFSVLSYLSIDYKMHASKKRASILCPSPEHNDRSHGNCIVDDKGWHCFRCGKHGDSLDLIMKTLGCEYPEGIKILLSIVGVETRYKKEHAPLVLSKKECSMIGLENGSVSVHVRYLNYDPPREKGKDLTYVETDIDTIESNETCYIVSMVADSNPLLSLKQSSEWEYKTLVQRYSEQAIRDNAEWLTDDENAAIYDSVLRRIYAIKAMMGRHGIRCSKATNDIVADAAAKVKKAKSVLV